MSRFHIPGFPHSIYLLQFFFSRQNYSKNYQAASYIERAENPIASKMDFLGQNFCKPFVWWNVL